jgi:AcrR family transcriptional regulator
MRRIASELGCTTGFIAHYFPTKDDLLLHALRIALKELEKAIGNAKGKSLWKLIDSFIESLPNDETQRTFWRTYIAYRSAMGSHAHLSAEALRWEEEASEALREGVARELGAPADSPPALLVADALDTLMEALGAAAAADPERFSRERVAKMLRGCAMGLLADQCLRSTRMES